MVSCRAPHPILRVLDSEKKVFCKVLEQVIEFFGAAITKRPHFFAQKCQKKATFWPKTVCLGPEWSVVGLPTLF